MTLIILAIAVIGSVAAATLTRSVRDKNEERLLAQRAEGVVSVIDGIAHTFESDLRAAAVHAGLGSRASLEDYIDRSRDNLTGSATWVLLEQTDGGVRPSLVVPEGATTYFDGVPNPSIDERLVDAFGGDFVIAGLFGDGPGRRLGVAAGSETPNGTDVAIYLEFPLLAAAADSSADESDSGESLFENIDVGLYVGEATSNGLILSTFDGEPPAGAMRRTLDLGGDRLIVVVDATTPLAGRLADLLPVIVLGVGLAIGVLGALVVEIANRRRVAALVLATELQAKHEALELAVQEQERAEAGMRVAQRNETLGQLASGIAHDFNNLLAVIVSYAELVAARVDASARADVAEILGAAERGAALTRQLLLFAKQGREVDGGSADVGRVVSDMARFLERTIGENISFLVDAPIEGATVPLTVGELEQVVLNLVVNARRAIDGAGLISIRARLTPDGTEAIIEVADDGVGMTAEIAERATEPFFSAGSSGTGTGLGLTIVDGLVRHGGGSLQLDSAPGKGTTVTVVLPVSPAADSAEPVPGAADHDAASETTVLLVEDEETVRRAMRRMLEGAGYRVHEACSGIDAIDRYIDASVPDVLLTDVMMPGGLSGREVADRFRTRHPNLPVVFVSGYNEDALLARGLVTGPVHVVAKPFTSADLLDAVADAVGAGAKTSTVSP